GDLVQMKDGAVIDASGSAGGGTVLVGGGFQGGGDTPTARRTLVEQGAQIAADSIDEGDGGTVVVWGDEAAVFDGAASARGGARGGNGGLVEVSSNGSVGISTGTVDVRAPNGEAGKWLIDPDNITIADTGTAASDTEVLFGDPPTDLEVDPDAIAAAAAGTTVVFQAEVDISVEDAVTSEADLVMQAGDDIFIDDVITMGADANLHLEAGSPHADEPIDGVVSFTDLGEDGIFGEVRMNGGTLTMIASDFQGQDLASSVNVAAGGDPALEINLSFLRDGSGIFVGSVEADLTAAEVLGLTADTEQLNIGKAMTAGTDGLGKDAQEITVASIDIDDDISFADGGRLAFFTAGDFTNDGFAIADQGVTPSDSDAPDLLIDVGGSVFFTNDASATATGDISVVAGSDISLVANEGDDISIRSGADIALTAGKNITSAALFGGSIEIQAADDLTLAAGGSIGALANSGDIDLVAADALNFTAGSTIDFSSSGGGIFAQGFGDVALDAGDSITALATGDGSSVILQGGRLLLLAGGDIELTEPTSVIPGCEFDCLIPPGNVILAGEGELALQAGGDIFSEAFLETNGGEMYLEADSPEAANGGDGTGTLTLGANAAIRTLRPISGSEREHGDLTLIAADFDLASATFIDVGNGDLLIAPSTSSKELTIGGAGSLLDAGELALLDATGQWSLGAALTAPGANGLQQLATAASVALNDSLTLPNINALLLYADGGIDGGFLQTPNLSVRAGGDVSLSVDADLLEVSAPGATVEIDESDGVVVGDVPITLGVPDANNVLGISAQDLTLNSTGSVTFNVAHDVPGEHEIISFSLATVTFNSPITGDGNLTVISDGPVNFNSTVNGLNSLVVDAFGDVNFAGAVGNQDTLGTVIVGDPGDSRDEVIALLSADDIEGASSLVANSGGDVNIASVFRADNLLLKPFGTSTSGPNALDVDGLLVGGTSAQLFGTVQGIGGPLAAFVAFSEPGEGSAPEDFRLNGCVIGTLCAPRFAFPPPPAPRNSFPEKGPFPEAGLLLPQVGITLLDLPEFLLPQDPRVAPDLEGRFSNSGNEEIW
ncbi:MAG: DUF2345 domain-containing protein, partial [Rhodospirillales bacterium]|nr:DUF2345 domain-containing protein [Rhodospirillales bacterium]